MQFTSEFCKFCFFFSDVFHKFFADFSQTWRTDKLNNFYEIWVLCMWENEVVTTQLNFLFFTFSPFHIFKHHWLLPINCHFRDCKARWSGHRVSCAISETDLYLLPFYHNRYLKADIFLWYLADSGCDLKLWWFASIKVLRKQEVVFCHACDRLVLICLFAIRVCRIAIPVYFLVLSVFITFESKECMSPVNSKL